MILNRVKHYNEKEKMNKKEEEKKEIIENDEENEEEEEIDYEDNHKNKMINSQDNIPRKKKKSIVKNNIFSYKLLTISSVLLVVLIILLVILNRMKNNNNNTNEFITLATNQTNETSINNAESNSNTNDNNNNNEEEEKKRINDEIINIFNSIGEINIIEFYEEKVCKNPYNRPDTSKFATNIHINVGFTEKDIDLIIKHLSSVLYNSAQTTYIHIHIMDADTFSYDSLIKLKNMRYKINNNSEIKVYNASPTLKDFKIKEDSINKFSKDYAKLYAFKILKDIQKIIFLDSDDCMVQKDLSELYNLEMNDIYARGITDVPSIKYPVDWLDKYLYDKSHYINGGVVLVNLELCQKDKFYEKAMELNNNEFYMNTKEPAQDILNVLMRKKIEFFHPKYNKINFYENPEDKDDESKWYPWVMETLKIGEKNNHFYTKEELLEADKDPVIIHYAWDAQLNKVIKKYEDDKNLYAKMAEI